MALKIKQNGEIKDLIIPACGIEVLDMEDNFGSSNLEEVLQELGEGDRVYISDEDPDKDGIWISSDNTTIAGENPTLTEVKEYVNENLNKMDKKVEVVSSQLNEKANQADLNTANTNISALQTSVGTSLTLSNGTKVWATAQRINKTVTIYIAVTIALTSNVAICTLPTGFTPLQPIQGIASENVSGSYQTGFRIDNTGVITLYSNSQSTVRTYIINVTYVTA